METDGWGQEGQKEEAQEGVVRKAGGEAGRERIMRRENRGRGRGEERWRKEGNRQEEQRARRGGSEARTRVSTVEIVIAAQFQKAASRLWPTSREVF